MSALATVTVYATDRNGGYTPGKILSLEVVRGLSSPADSLRAQIACDTPARELYRVEARAGGELLFTGEPDVQRLALSGGGRILTLEARGAGAALLDNEARPCEYTNINLDFAFTRFIKPYGFTLRCPHARTALAQFSVNKGMSEWEAFCAFAWHVYGLTPYLDSSVVALERPSFPVRHILSNTGDGLRFIRLEHRNNRHKVLSRVYIRDPDGQYRTYVQSYVAERAKIQRTRYNIPPDEYADYWKMDAVQRAYHSLWEKEQVHALLPGLLRAQPGDGVYLRQEGFPTEKLYIEELRYRLDKTGEYTELALYNPAYYS